MKVKDVRPGHVATMYTALRANGNRRGRSGDGLSPTSLQHTHELLTGLFGYAVRQRLVAFNVMADVERPKRVQRRMRVWVAGDLARLLEVAAGDRLAGLWRTAAMAACRRSELLGLLWDDVELDGATLTVRRKGSVSAAAWLSGRPRNPGPVSGWSTSTRRP